MLGSHFDLDKEVAAIAAKRALQDEAPPAPAEDAYADVDQKLAAFLRAIAPEAFSNPDSLIDLKRRQLR